jgi:hypothetical protein
MYGLELVAEARIAEAIAAGAFTGLPGAGRPLVLDDEADVPAEWRVAFHLLRNAGFRPEWIETRREIREAAVEARARLAAVSRVSPARASAEAAFAARAQAINRQVRDLNLKLPGPRWQIRPIDVAQELDRLAPPTDAEAEG